MNKLRVNFILAFVVLLSGLLIFRLYQVQIQEGDYWKALAQGQQKFFSRVEGERGSVFIQNRNKELIPLAINRSWTKAYISPREILGKGEDVEELVEELSHILDVEASFILERMQRESSSFEVLKRRLSEEEKKLIQEMDFSGVYLREEANRFYPQQDLAAHVIGFVGGENTGQYGIEGFHDELLRGVEGVREGKRTVWGSLVTRDSAQTGSSLILSIDYNIQFTAERLLKQAAKDYEIAGGTVIVGDPQTGAILALTNYPSFNPNSYAESPSMEVFKNSAVQNLFEPGSVFKPLVMAMALEEGSVTPTTIYNDTGNVTVSGHTIHNYNKRIWGEVNMTDIVKNSINTGMVFVEKQMGHNVFLDYLRNLDFFKETGIELQGEVYSDNRSFLEGYDINFATASFGQGFKVTPIQLFASYLSIASGGDLIRPYILEDGTSKPEVIREVFSSKTVSQITAMMVASVKDGFGQNAAIDGYYVAGKTGTAQIPWSSLGVNRSGYSNETIQGFIGYAPASNPRFLILVVLDRPNTRSAGYSAAPLFKDLAEYIIDYKQIPPDYRIDD